MSKELHLKHLLDALNAYVDNMPLPGSSEYLRFTKLCNEFAGHLIAMPEHPLATEFDVLGLKIDAVVSRYEGRNDGHDLSADGENAAPTIGCV